MAPLRDALSTSPPDKHNHQLEQFTVLPGLAASALLADKAQADRTANCRENH
jgi:hypothetical protein